MFGGSTGVLGLFLQALQNFNFDSGYEPIQLFEWVPGEGGMVVGKFKLTNICNPI